MVRIRSAVRRRTGSRVVSATSSAGTTSSPTYIDVATRTTAVTVARPRRGRRPFRGNGSAAAADVGGHRTDRTTASWMTRQAAPRAQASSFTASTRISQSRAAVEKACRRSAPISAGPIRS